MSEEDIISAKLVSEKLGRIQNGLNYSTPPPTLIFERTRSFLIITGTPSHICENQ